jgi:[ribosomal protein S18]-alanine N-acetyltransferase
MQPNSSLHIEPTSNAEDFAVCAKIMCKTDPWVKLGMDYNACLKAFEGPFKEVFLLKKGTGIIGFVIMQTQGTFKGYIQTIAVDAAYRGEGYGTQLLQFCQHRILTYSPNIFICVSSFNEGAVHLYNKLGFELVGELKDFLKPGFTELLLRKTVGPIAGYKSHAVKS